MMDKVFKFNFVTFTLAFIFGIIYIFISTPKPRTIIKYPTPYNSDKLIYKSDNGDCYKFKSDLVKCGDNSLPQPII